LEPLRVEVNSPLPQIDLAAQSAIIFQNQNQNQNQNQSRGASPILVIKSRAKGESACPPFA